MSTWASTTLPTCAGCPGGSTTATRGAVLALVREAGYEGLTLDAVAARAHVSKATLYRQRTAKATLIAQALKRIRQPNAQTADTGSLRGDFAAIIARFDDRRASQDTAMMHSLMHAAHTAPELMRALREVLIDPEHEDLQKMLRRAVARGEVSPDNPALGCVMHMMVGRLRRPRSDRRPAPGPGLRPVLHRHRRPPSPGAHARTRRPRLISDPRSPQRQRSARSDAAHERSVSAVPGHDLRRAVSLSAEAAQSTVGLIPTAANLRATTSYSSSVMPGLPLTMKSRCRDAHSCQRSNAT